MSKFCPNLVWFFEKRTISINKNIKVLFTLTFNDVNNLFRDHGGIDMTYNEVEVWCRQSCKAEGFNYPLNDRSHHEKE